MSEVLIPTAEAAVSVELLDEAGTPEALAGDGLAAALATMGGFKGQAGQLLVAPDEGGGVRRVLFGLGERRDAMLLRQLPSRLPAGDYRLECPAGLDPTLAAAAFGIGGYVFDRYKAERGKPRARLAVPEGANLAEARRLVHADALARDLINTPAGDLGPLQVETVAREVAAANGAAITVVTGADLLEQNFPAIHAVGRAAAPDRQPRLIEIAWGDPAAPVVCLVGKGVTFDTGGLNLKTGAGMKLMKKDMGGAAHALAVGRMAMEAGLAVRLIVLLPVVENAVSGDAVRPGDVIGSRKGVTIEVGNTDAEGRLILADALTRAGEHDPVLTIDFATLTGAARVALGPQLPPVFTDDEALAADLLAAATTAADPVWRMPLWPGYESALNSDIADLTNDPDGWAQAGAVTAALFLKRFAPATGAWAHLDVMAWNPKTRPGWPAGGELQGARAVYALLKSRFRG